MGGGGACNNFGHIFSLDNKLLLFITTMPQLCIALVAIWQMLACNIISAEHQSAGTVTVNV